MAPRQCTVAAVLMIALTLTPFGALVDQHQATILKNAPTWTIMVYMADDAVPDLPWQDNINQMEAANQSPGTNILVLVDSLGSNTSMLLRIVHDDGTHGNQIISPEADDSGAVIPANRTVNMASPETLRAFITFCVTNYTADHLVLIMWGHAGGWFGLCPDGHDILTLPEFAQALSDAKNVTHRNLDVIGIDACGEATVETLYEIYPYADYLVGSEKNIPNEGLPYTPILNRLWSEPSQSPLDFASGIVDDFIGWSRFNSSISASMGVFNLTRMDGFRTSLNRLATIGIKYDSLFYEAVNASFTSAQTYTEYWNIDLGDLLGRMLSEPLPPDLRSAATDVMRSYLDVCPKLGKLELGDPLDGEHVVRATGLVIYAPRSVDPDRSYSFLTIADGPWYLFGRLARHEGIANSSDVVPVVKYNDHDNDGLTDSVTLTWPGTFEFCDASVLRQESQGLSLIGYESIPGNRLTVEGVGHLTISANAMYGGVAQAHALVNVTLFGDATVDVKVAGVATDSVTGLTVRITTSNWTDSKDIGSGTARFNLSLPTQGEPGDLVEVQVLDGDGIVLGETHMALDPVSTVATVEIHQPPQKGLPDIAIILAALIPGLLILLFDLQLYEGDKKKGAGPKR